MEYKNNNTTHYESNDKYKSAIDIIMELKEDDFKKKYELNSIGINKKTLDIERRKTQKKKEMIANKVAATLLVIVGISIGLGISNITKTPTNQNTETTISYNQEKSAEDLLKEYVKLLLIENNLATLNTQTGEFNLNDNSISDYKKLNITAPTRDTINNTNLTNKEHLLIYGIKEVLEETNKKDMTFIQKITDTEPTEFNKFIQSVTDGYTEYENIVNFYRLGGYLDQTTHNASEAVFDNYMENYIKTHQDELKTEYTNSINNLKYKNSLYSLENSTNDNLVHLSTAARGGR